MTLAWLRASAWSGTLLVAVALAWLIATRVLRADAWLPRVFASHQRRLRWACEATRLPINGARLAWAQLFGCATALVLSLVTGTLAWLSALLLIGGIPELVLAHAKAERTRAIEEQVDTWLLTLANALKAVPSLGEAMGSCIPLLGGPLAQELEVALHEYQLGSPLNVALRQMAVRVGSPVLLVATTTLEIARKTGGALSETLELSAASLRELARLEGVVRTKTAESKAQAWVISVIPAVILFVLDRAAPDVIAVLFESSRGHVVLAIAAVLWVAAIASAIKILHVDV